MTGYNYQEQRANLFTDEGQRMFIKVRDKVEELLNTAGAFMMQKVIWKSPHNSKDWDTMACVDRMVELREIVEVTPLGSVGQHRIFIRKDT